MQIKNIKLWGINLLRNLFLDWFASNTDTIETVGEKIAGTAGETLDVICSTDSKEKIDQENSIKAKRNMFTRFLGGINRGGKKILKDWE